MRVLAFANQKGGCGKTTAAIHLAGALAARGRRVLLVDLDPQAHATLGLGCAPAGLGGAPGGEPTVGDVLLGRSGLAAAVQAAPGGIDLLPADPSLADFEEESARLVGPERVLGRALEEVAERYDEVLLDCPPRADGVLTANALRAADVALLVVETGAFALQGALRARELLLELAGDEDRVPALAVLATMFDRRTRFAREVLVALHARFGPAMFDTVIRTSVRLREAAARGVPVQVLDPGCRAAADFDALASEWLARVDLDPAPDPEPDPEPGPAPPRRSPAPAGER